MTLSKIREEFMDNLTTKIAVMALSILGSGLFGFKIARSQDKEEMKREVNDHPA